MIDFERKTDSYLNVKSYRIVMEYRLSTIVSKGEKYFVARGIEIELASQGMSIEEALANLKEAFELWLKHAEPEELKVFKKPGAPLVTQVAAAA